MTVLGRVLLADAGPEADAYAAALRHAGLEVRVVRGADETALSSASQADVTVVAPGGAGASNAGWMRAARGAAKRTTLLLLVPEGDAALALAAARLGAGAIERPVEPRRLVEAVRAALDRSVLVRRIDELEARLGGRPPEVRLVAHSRAMARVAEQIRQIGPVRGAVLIEGEPGSGKHLVALALHRSGRREGAFVRVDCAALPPHALEGAIFGAAEDPGRLELAQGGTLYLAAIEAAPPGVQVQLLRVLQERAWQPPGSPAPVRADVRVLAGAERDLAAEVRAGAFRSDLYERLSALRVSVPPLRERREDLPLLVHRLLRERHPGRGRKPVAVTPGLLERLASHDWPGNVRELEDALETMATRAGTRRELELSDLPPHLGGRVPASERVELVVGSTVADAERALIAATLLHANFDKARAAALLGIGLRTLYRKLPAGTAAKGRRRKRR